MRRSNKSWQRLAEMREGDGKPQAAMSCQLMAEMRGMYGAASSSRSLPEDGGDGGRGMLRRAAKSCKRLAEMRKGKGMPQNATSWEVMAEMRGMERVATSCR